MSEPLRRFRRLRWAARAGLVLILALGGFVGWRRGTGNLGVVVPGAIYRSAQLSAGSLDRAIRGRSVRTVLNLRGANPDTDWYQAERAATIGAGAVQVDVAMASDQWLSRAQMKTLVTLVDQAERPIWVHCEFGAERTGLVSALAELLRPGGSLASARRQFSAWYLFLPVRDGAIMRGHLDAYESWLAGQGGPSVHSPETFRRWALDTYRPGSPSREEWPYDPYPLKVVTRPPARPAGRR